MYVGPIKEQRDEKKCGIRLRLHKRLWPTTKIGSVWESNHFCRCAMALLCLSWLHSLSGKGYQILWIFCILCGCREFGNRANDLMFVDMCREREREIEREEIERERESCVL